MAFGQPEGDDGREDNYGQSDDYGAHDPGEGEYNTQASTNYKDENASHEGEEQT